MSPQILAHFFFSSYETIGSSSSRQLILGKTLSSGVKLRHNGTLICWLMKKKQSDVLNLPKQCFNLLVDICGLYARPKTNSPLIFLHFQKVDSHLQIALISKRFETQQRDWSQMIELSK